MKKKLLWIGGGILFAGVIIGARVIYINKKMDEIGQANFTPEVMNLITNGNPEELEYVESDVPEEVIEAEMESLFASISTDELEEYLEEYGYNYDY
jgi:hypothetical protein